MLKNEIFDTSMVGDEVYGVVITTGCLSLNRFEELRKAHGKIEVNVRRKLNSQYGKFVNYNPFK